MGGGIAPQPLYFVQSAESTMAELPRELKQI